MNGKAFYFIIVLTLIVGGCKGVPDQKTGGKYYRRGIEAYHRGEYEQAAEYFEKTIIFNPRNPDPYLAAGEIYDDYLNEKTKAHQRYLKFITLSDNEELRAMVLNWLGESPPADAADTESVEPTAELEKLDNENSSLKIQLAAIEKENQNLRAKLDTELRRSKLRWDKGNAVALISAALIIVAALLLIALLPKLRETATAAIAPSQKKIIHNISAKYYWIEDEAKSGMVIFASGSGNEIKVTTYDNRGVKKSSGKGKLSRGTLNVKLKDGKGYEAITRFEFHNRGRTFTAAWRDKLGSGMATGIKEKTKTGTIRRNRSRGQTTNAE